MEVLQEILRGSVKDGRKLFYRKRQPITAIAIKPHNNRHYDQTDRSLRYKLPTPGGPQQWCPRTVLSSRRREQLRKKTGRLDIDTTLFQVTFEK